MTVRELIQLLSKENPETDVMVMYDGVHTEIDYIVKDVIVNPIDFVSREVIVIE